MTKFLIGAVLGAALVAFTYGFYMPGFIDQAFYEGGFTIKCEQAFGGQVVRKTDGGLACVPAFGTGNGPADPDDGAVSTKPPMKVSSEPVWI